MSKNKPFPISMIISGGQTGIDRAALDFALEKKIKCSGWCPKGRKADDGIICYKYPLIETSTCFYPQRTRQNVKDSDATMIITDGSQSRGTNYTQVCAIKLNKPLLIVDLTDINFEKILKWLWKTKPEILNIAGPRKKEASNTDIKNLLTQILCKAEKTAPIWPRKKPTTANLNFYGKR